MTHVGSTHAHWLELVTGPPPQSGQEAQFLASNTDGLQLKIQLMNVKLGTVPGTQRALFPHSVFHQET